MLICFSIILPLQFLCNLVVSLGEYTKPKCSKKKKPNKFFFMNAVDSSRALAAANNADVNEFGNSTIETLASKTMSEAMLISGASRQISSAILIYVFEYLSISPC